MEKTLGDFVRSLRKADLEVSPAETLVAMQALDIIGLRDRRLIQDTLSIILAKTPEEKATFQICFDRFFSFRQFTPHTAIRHAATADVESGAMALGGEDEREGDSAASPGNRASRKRRRRRATAHVSSRLGELLLSGDGDALALMMSAAGRVVDLGKIRTLRERGLFSRRIMLHMGLADLDSEISRLQHADDDGSRAMAAELTDARHYLAEQVRDFVEEQYLMLVDGSGNRFLSDAVSQTKLTNMQVYYFGHIREVVRKLAKQLAKKHAKRRKIYNRGQLDIRKTLRHNMQYDGSLFNIKWKQIRRQRPRVFVICDVSGSVKNVSRFLLTFLYSLNEVLPRVRSFAFSNDLGEVTELFEQYALEEAIEMSLRDYGKGSTDYGQAFRRFRELALGDLDSRSTVIIMGDARSNYFEPGVEALKQISSRARQVIWLNPESRDKWRAGDAEMKAYLPHCQYAEVCNSLADLERMVSRVLRSAH